jgi:ABC-type sugar transport system ATPase subunit
VQNLLEMKGISKSFAKNKVLETVDFDVRAGEVHALLGENGAGKSTLVKILGGIYTPDGGGISLDGKKCVFGNALDAQKSGVSILHQELMLMPHLSIAENIFMGRELTGALGLVRKKAQEKKAQELLDTFELKFSAATRLEKLTIAQQQMVEIIRAISFNAKVIAMDEPTSSLSEHEAEKLFALIRTLKERQVGIILISHRLNDIFTLADRVTVLRDGVNVGTVAVAETDNDALIKMMVGRDVEQFYARSACHATDEVVMQVENLSDGKMVKNVSFSLHKGEILGVSGLVGAGRSETMQCLFGLRKRKTGTVTVNGREVSFEAPWEAIDGGLGYVCEDRKREGLFLKQDVRFNTGINVLKQFLSFRKYDRTKENKLALAYAEKLQTKITGITQITGFLSGGNQQKVLISRWLACTGNILLLDEPTRGVDVKTKQDIYALMSELVQQGMSIVFVSSELSELLNVCDRIMVMSDGDTTGILERDAFDQEEIMKLATKAFRRGA